MREYVYLNGQRLAFITQTNSSPLPPAIDFNLTPIESYGGSQDKGGTITIEDAGATVRIVGNAWKKITLPYTITTDTIIEFDFSSSAQGEIHGIGFDTDNGISSNRTFKLYGTQSWGNLAFNNYNGSGNLTHYQIPVGQYYTGSMNYLFFTNDHDVSNATAEGVFSNIRIYEANPVPSSTEGIFYLHTDHLDTPTAVSDESGDIQWKAHYTPFGKAVVEINNLENNIRFPGQYFDAETGLHYNYFRDYDPEIGRYLQSDPIGLAGGMNTYGYVGGNPVNAVDPFGLSSCTASPAAIDACSGYSMSQAARAAAARAAARAAASSNSDENCECENWTLVYEENGKHGKRPKIKNGKYIGRAPSDGALVLPLSVELKPGYRIGYDVLYEELIVFRQHRFEPNPICIRYFHGYVVDRKNQLRQIERNAARKNRWPIPKKKWEP